MTQSNERRRKNEQISTDAQNSIKWSNELVIKLSKSELKRTRKILFEDFVLKIALFRV